MWTGSRLEPEPRSERITLRLTPTELRSLEQFPGTISDRMRRIIDAGLAALTENRAA